MQREVYLLINMNETWILYQTTNNVNGKIYLGVHKADETWNSRKYLGSGTTLKAAIEKYGREKFTRITLAKFNCADDAYFLESLLVDESFTNRKDTYNLKIGGMGGTNSFLGKTHSKETKAKIGASSKGRVKSEETRKRISLSNKGKQARLGKLHSEETKLKIGIKGKGRVKSEEERRKLSIANKGKIVSLETRAKLSAAQKGKPHTAEAKAKMSAVSPKSKAAIIKGEHYVSVKLAAETLGIPYTSLLYQVKNNKYGYYYTTGKEKSVSLS